MNPTRTDSRLREAARAIFAACTGSPARRIRAQGGGLTNSVYFAEGSDGSYVIRMDPSAAKANEYRKERWAIDHARRLDIPAPKVIEVGTTHDGISFMLALGLIDDVAARRVAEVVRRLGAGRDPRLNHGDLRLKNGQVPFTPALVALNMLHYAPFADAAARAGDDGLLRRYRRRFARAYDLYSL